MMNKLLIGAGIMFLSAAGSLLAADGASAHGYVEGSRGDLCVKGINLNCANAIPADTEHPGTFPQSGAPDGKFGSAGRPYEVLDEQTSTRWYKHGMSSGFHEFKWTIPAQHISDNYKYYITKPGWNPNQPLTRDSFDLTPFCSVDDKGKSPGNPTHGCTIPARTGYHVILALWQVDYTGNTFYSLIDGNFDGQTTPGTGGGTTDPGTGGTTDPSTGTAAAWSLTKVYNYGDLVSYNGSTWKAKWYTQGQAPGTTGQYGVWEKQ
ncbi:MULTISPECIES: lytic polysaccharide monooxygenase [Paenibacillus]|uniref:lytic polysaccharide monooxygenase n=1 Tax=Paenibacillus TaxID=44249 RepID=UPI0022B86E5A|nr:lytic polysaccharide monooxygenase [Paenibacillus caseinilyticus]MCZ8518288.1 lytic polysaccharide monooxygenase [Paenibacillus caseinilyticus]